ncbi:MAG: valine--tRNA ligase [Anaerolineae bacterium]
MRAMSKTEMSKTYDPQSVEKRLYDWWEAQWYFTPQIDWDRVPFVISMPPPNVTGALHVGHAITATIQDLMIRWHRMRGEPTLWLPGSDHASIAVHNVLERKLAEEKGMTRHDLGREKFIEMAWDWVRKTGGTITEQHRRLGTSCDWTRERFTMDEGLSRAVREAFVRLYRRGLIYRGEYLINWCPRCGTALSDLEVEHEEEPGKLWYVRYPLTSDQWPGPRDKWGSGNWAEGAHEFIAVATTRPETILGDTAVAVNPGDERYKALLGRTAVLPALGREIPIIADRVVDPEFGTGAVKVTPGHDPNDYEIGQRHGLPTVNAMNPDATMNEEAGPYAGLHRQQARRRLVDDLEKEGLLVKVEDHLHAPGRCQRCSTLVEPLISTQWFVRIKPLAEPAIQAVREGRIRIVPERFTKVYFNWMENIRDWCISRQLWWGHRIPVWYCDDCEGLTVDTVDPTECEYCGSQNIHQDEDILDTWFSSGLWPFSTLGWPDDTEDLRYFYPTMVMETAYDILFFWVARMIMLGLECTGDIPFRVVYLHGLIRDAKGQKMSKSKGNVVDPLDVMDRYGTDALRFTLVTGSTPGNDMKLSEQRLEASRNFANKIWNAARFVLSVLSPRSEVRSQRLDLGLRTSDFGLPDRWILSRHNRLIEKVNRLMETYQFGEAGRQIYDFLWGEYCDWYIEIAKIRLYGDALSRMNMRASSAEAESLRESASGEDEEAKETARHVLVYTLERTLRLLHPFMPFVTEEIWQHMKGSGTRDKGQGETSPPKLGGTEGGQWPEALIVAPWPEPGPTDEAAEEDMALIMEIVRGIRNARAEYNVEPGRRIAAIVAADGQLDLLTSHADIIATLARVDSQKLHIEEKLEKVPAQALTLVVGGVQVYLPLAGMVDLTREQARLSKEIEELKTRVSRSESLLANQDFVTKAPHHVVDRERQKMAEARQRLSKLQERLKTLSA